MTERTEVSNLADYFIAERVGRRMVIYGRRKPMLFWQAYSKKLELNLNCGRKKPRFFVVNNAGEIVSTIDRKVKTMPRAA